MPRGDDSRPPGTDAFFPPGRATPVTANTQQERKLARNVAVIYAVLVGMWIFLSSGIPVGFILGIEVAETAWLQSFAGWFFVVSSAWLLYLMVNRHLTSVRESEAALKLRDRAIESSVNAIVITDARAPGEPIVYVNPAFERITGFSAAEAVGRDWIFLYGDDADQPGLEGIRAALRNQREGHAVLRNYRKDGSLFWNELFVAPVRDPDGGVSHFVGVLNDITDNRRYQEELEHQANHDSLTDLPNRNLLRDRIGQAIVFADRYDQVAVIAFLDLDNFKLVNDSLGHDAGDQLLKLAAGRLASLLRASDTVARIGGDEFVLVLHFSEGDGMIGQHIQRLLTAIAQPFSINGREVFVTCSVGVSIYPQDGRDGDTLLKNADAAMYRAKEQGKNTFQFYTRELNERVSERLDLESDLRRALERGELAVYYQPQVELATGRIVGAEALVRWRHPSRGAVEPGRFVMIAEETGLIVPIGDWILRTACEQIKAWQGAGLAPLVVAVNLSARQFRQTQLADMVEAVLSDTRVEPRFLELELTETVVMHDPQEAEIALRRLKSLGLRVAIDDFGSGYSSLNYLKRFPIDKLKIDGSFVQDLPESGDSAAIVLAVISLGHSLGLRVIAEGVERRSQAAFLRAHGCDEIQGYYYGAPMPAPEFTELLRSPPALDAGEAA
jgi:diguanylate cyclase (GGDEF)-like protein/PAS domain S-box-containing protein